jgi:hypothetical protein
VEYLNSLSSIFEEEGVPDPFPGQLLHAEVYLMKLLERMMADPDHDRRLDSKLHTYRPDPNGPAQLRWTTASIGAMATEEILQAFDLLNISLDKEGFKRLARGRTSVIELAKECLETPDELPKPYDVDFVWMGALELWRRLLPGRPCVEMIEMELQEGYHLLEESKLSEAVDHWEEAWRLLKRAVPRRIRSIEEAELFLTGLPPRQLPGWCGDFGGVLSEPARQKRAFAERRLAFLTDFLGRFPESGREMVFVVRVAVASMQLMLGERGLGRGTFEALAGDFPDEPLVYMIWADCLWKPPATRKGDVRLKDRVEAEGLYRRALALGGGLEHVAERRLHDLRQYDNDGFS